MKNKIILALVIVFVLWLISSCGGDKSPQELRADFEKEMAGNVKQMLGLPKSTAECVAKALSKTLSDDEISLMMGSFMDRASNPEKGMAIQRKIQSEQFLLRLVKECN